MRAWDDPRMRAVGVQKFLEELAALTTGECAAA
jgi:hypothetical protein